MFVNHESGVIGITGASGHLGRRVVELVTERLGAGRVVAITRSPEKLADFAAQGVQVRRGDLADPAGLPAAFSGVDRLYVISVDDTSEGTRPRLHGNAVTAAKQVGVEHLIYSSGIKPHYSPITFLRDHGATEQLIVESGIPFTFLRNNFYMETVLQSGAQTVATGTLFAAAQGGAVGYVSREDCARAAAAVLASSGHEGAIYDITGQYAYTQAEIAGELSKAVGHPIDYVALSDEELQQGMIANGLPAHVAAFIVGMERGIRLGALDVVSRAVATLTGTPPESLPDFLARHRSAFQVKQGE
jgi:NAD(P)H dehydrogenase (quinone)